MLGEVDDCVTDLGDWDSVVCLLEGEGEVDLNIYEIRSWSEVPVEKTGIYTRGWPPNCLHGLPLIDEVIMWSRVQM